jgi:hypothetical protein
MRRLVVACAIVAVLLAAWLLARSKRPSASSHQPSADLGTRAVERARPAPPLRLPNATAHADASGAGLFAGRVLSTADGAPIAHAALTFLHEGAALSTESDDGGRFAVRAASPGAYELTAAGAKGFESFEPQLGHSPVTVQARAGVRLDDVTIYLSPALELVVTVEDAEHAAVAGAEVRTFDADHGAAEVTPILTDAKGQATLPAAHWYDLVEAKKAGYARARAWIDQKILARHKMTLTLVRGADRALLSIGGRVVDRGGRPVDGALVEAFGKPGFGGDGPAGAQTLSGVDGAFVLAALDDARYTLRATTRGEGGVMVDDVPAGKRDVELRLGATTAVLHGVVRDGSGKPVTAFSVVAFPTEGVLGRGPEVRATIIDAEGRYTLPLPAGHYAVAAAARGFARSSDRAVDVGDDGAELDFTLRGASRIFGRVVERVGGAPITGAEVLFEGASLQDGITVASDARSGADGSFAIEGVPSGRQSINVQAAGHDGRILGALAVPPEGALGPLTIDLAKSAPGEDPKTELVGIAASIGARPEGMVIIGIAPGGGAADAGLAIGDVILAIDGQTVGTGLGFVDAIQMIRGPENTIVVMTIKRKDGSVQTIPVARKRVSL